MKIDPIIFNTVSKRAEAIIQRKIYEQAIEIKCETWRYGKKIELKQNKITFLAEKKFSDEQNRLENEPVNLTEISNEVNRVTKTFKKNSENISNFTWGYS